MKLERTETKTVSSGEKPKTLKDSLNKWELAHKFGTIYGVEEAAAMMEVLLNWAPTNREKTREFEKKFAEFVGAKHALAVNSCASALHLAAIAISIKPGDEVIVPTLTFYASANPFVFQGAKIVFAESDRRTFNLDPSRLEEKVTPRTKAIVSVSLCGEPCDMDSVMEIADKHDLVVIDDAARAIGAEYKGRKVGSLGDITAFSFQQTKNMSTLGEGGMATTDIDKYAELMELYRSNGSGVYPGLNYRMTDVQAAVGIEQLKKLQRHNDIRRELAHYLTRKLRKIDGVVPPCETPNMRHVYYLYMILIEPEKIGMNRDVFVKKLLDEKGIACNIQEMVHECEAYRKLGYKKGECPVTEEFGKRLVILPLCPRYTFNDMDYVVQAIEEIVKKS